MNPSVAGVIIEFCEGYIVWAQMKQGWSHEKDNVLKVIQAERQDTGMQAEVAV